MAVQCDHRLSMHDVLTVRRLLPLVGAAALGTTAYASGPGGATAQDAPVETTPAILLAPPVVRSYATVPGYDLFLRTDRALNPVGSSSYPTVAVSIPALAVRSRSEHDGTVSERSRLGGWCTRLTLNPTNSKTPRKHAAPAAISITLTSAGGLRAQTLGVLATATGRLPSPDTLPKVKLGCKAIGAPN